MKRISKVATVLTLFVGGALGAQAVPAYPGVLTMTQPDGSSIRVRLYGDERGHYYTTENGRMVSPPMASAMPASTLRESSRPASLSPTAMPALPPIPPSRPP